MRKYTIKRQPIKKQKTKIESFKDKIKAIPKKTSKLDELIYSIPDFDKKELRIIKINGTYYEVSKDRTEHSVGADERKYVALLNLERIFNKKIYSVKDIHTHIGNDPLPSPNDIISAISLYQHTPQTLSFPIIIIDPKTRKISGRSIIYLGKNAIKNIIQNSGLKDLTKEKIEKNVVLEYNDYIFKNRLFTSGRDRNTGEVIPVPSKDAKSFALVQYEYLKSKIGYKIRIQAYPGYRLNRKTMTIEKV